MKEENEAKLIESLDSPLKHEWAEEEMQKKLLKSHLKHCKLEQELQGIAKLPWPCHLEVMNLQPPAWGARYLQAINQKIARMKKLRNLEVHLMWDT
jgi:hypothetical protein